jgi:folate-binding protein YgfZ
MGKPRDIGVCIGAGRLALHRRKPQIGGMSPTVTFAHLQSRSLIALEGPDWRSFLQGLITQDVETEDRATGRFGALLTPQGRLLYDLFVVEREDGAWLDVEAEHRDALFQRLTMYRLRAKVELAKDETMVFAAFPSGPLPLAGRDGDAVDETAAPGPSPQGEGVIVRDGRLPQLGWRCYGSFEATATEADREAQKLALGVPGPADWGADKTYPIEANFDLLNGIDFKKGCFVGQETTSRMKRRGTIKNRMLPLVFDGPPPAFGTEILAGELRAGEVLSGADGRAIALVRLDRALGAELTVDGRPARVEVPAWMAEAVVQPVT